MVHTRSRLQEALPDIDSKPCASKDPSPGVVETTPTLALSEFPTADEVAAAARAQCREGEKQADVVMKNTMTTQQAIENLQRLLIERCISEMQIRTSAPIEARAPQPEQPRVLSCWCCGADTPIPEKPIDDLPCFAASFQPQWLIPSIHCANQNCMARRLGQRRAEQLGKGASTENAGALLALHYRHRWRPLNDFVCGGEEQQNRVADGIRNVQDCLGGERLALALLYRVFKPYDDYIDACQLFQQEQKQKQDTQNATDNDKYEQENNGALLNQQSQTRSGDAAQPEKAEEASKSERNPLCRYRFAQMRSLQYAGVDRSARISWIHGFATGFYTFSVAMLANGRALPYLNAIYVRREYRRRGIAQALVRDFYRHVVPSIARNRNQQGEADSDKCWAGGIETPITTIVMELLEASLEPHELDRIACISPSASIEYATSVSNWILFQRLLKTQLPKSASSSGSAPASASSFTSKSIPRTMEDRKALREEAETQQPPPPQQQGMEESELGLNKAEHGVIAVAADGRRRRAPPAALLTCT